MAKSAGDGDPAAGSVAVELAEIEGGEASGGGIQNWPPPRW